MSATDQLVARLMDRSLNEQEAEQLIDAMESDPGQLTSVLQDVCDSDVINREVDPARSDAAFLQQFNVLLAAEIAGGGNGDGNGPDGDGSNVDVTSQNPGPVSPDPVSAAASTTASTAGGGLLGPAIGTAIAIVIGGAVYLNQKPKPTPPVAVVEQAAAPAAAPEYVEVVAEADAFALRNLSPKYPGGEGNTDRLEVVQGPLWVFTKYGVLRFDLSNLKGEVESARLRLYCLETPEPRLKQELRISAMYDDWTEESISQESFAGPLGQSPQVAGNYGNWVPEAGEFAEIDVTKAFVSGRLPKNGKLSFWIRSTFSRDEAASVKPHPASVFASREHANTDWRPTLRIQLKQ